MMKKKTILAAAISATLSVPSVSSALSLQMDFSGLLTMLNPTGTALNNTDQNSVSPWYGWRTPVSGSMSFDLLTQSGTGSVTPFSFFGSGEAITTAVTFQAIGDGMGGAGSLILGNMGFNWNGNNGIPVSIVLDAGGFFEHLSTAGVDLNDPLATPLALAGLAGDLITGGGLAASDNTVFSSGKQSYTLPIGPAPIVTTTFNTTDIGTVMLGTNPSGTTPLVVDTVTDATNGDIGIGGSPMRTSPFPGFNANFDFTQLTVTSVEPPPPPIPVPPAVWLFGSGLLGLVGVARRGRNKTQ